MAMKRQAEALEVRLVVERKGRRVYVRDAVTGVRIGWRDEQTGMVHFEDGADLALVHVGLKAWDRD